MQNSSQDKDDFAELAKLANDFAELWRENVAMQAVNPNTIHWISTWLQTLAPPGGVSGENPTPGPEAPGHASGDIGRRLDDIICRLDRIEARLADLERGSHASGAEDPGESTPR